MRKLVLRDVYDLREVADWSLYQLLSERTREQSISHVKMPTWAEHIAFIDSRPYLAWYLILVYESDIAPDVPTAVGTVYLSKQREIGIFLHKFDCQGKGYGKRAVQALMELHPGKFFANINEKNEASIKFFRNLGFRSLQITLTYENGTDEKKPNTDTA